MSPEQELQPLYAWLCVAVAGGLVCAGTWLLGPGGDRRLPPQRRRAVPWSGPEVFVVVLATALWPALWYGLLQALLGQPTDEDKDFLQQLATALAFPFQLTTMLLIPRLCSGTRLYQLGLTWHRWPNNVILGCLGWLVLSPLVFGVNALTVLCYEYVTGTEPAEHPLTRLVQGPQPTELGWALVFFLAVFEAPLLEELLFRGVLQLWLTRRPWGGHLVMAAALLLSAPEQRGSDGYAKTLFVLALLPPYLVLPQLMGRWGWRTSSAATAQAIYGTAVLFAVVHPWPTPVPLFVLGLGLGWLAYRTQSLVASMTLHALFNSVACVLLWLSR